MDIEIIKAEDRQLKKDTARLVLESLQDWFGIESAREQYIRSAADEVMFIGYAGDDPAGFLCLKETGRDTVEISVMGICEKYQRQGIGRKLFQEAYRHASESGYSFMQVKTVRKGCYEEYDRTNEFYKSLGFKEFEVIDTLWDEANPAQIYVMHIS